MAIYFVVFMFQNVLLTHICLFYDYLFPLLLF